ncbi:disease resistance protein At4g27190-like isoform X3 [Amaranthus tricolor]|uniref:disease resistance protein At4g27190-like isoform X3 n=1 Tax=Amaranthus tricolor TaxID=29722 RepID=UPI00258B4729|nr:disease resistance protein At4g27190-like isoform X3 [Amaranthus tricolor]
MKELRRVIDELGCIEKEVQDQVNIAKEEGGEIDEQINNWLGEVHKMSAKVKTVWLAVEKANTVRKRRLIGCFRPSKKSYKDVLEMENGIVGDVSNLMEEGKKILEACQHSYPKGIELVWRDDFVEFRSRRSAFNMIMNGLEDEKVSIIGAFGMGGIGKTKLVVESGKRAKDDKLFDQVVFATVSRDPHIVNIQGTLADMLGLNFKEVTEIGRANELRGRMEKEKNILVILDDIWGKLDLESVGVPSNLDNKGVKIILTTRKKEVCEAMGCSVIVHLDVMKTDETWAMFCNYAGQPLGYSLTRVAKKIVKECAGLPLAVVTVGSALRDKSLEEYEDAVQKLSKSRFAEIESVDRDIYACLKMSFDYLEDEISQKCFLLCSLFPEDSEIKLEDLTRNAIGLGLFGNVDSVDQARNRMLSLVKKLENVCLLATVDDSRYFRQFVPCHNRVKMHDMIRDVALWITKVNGIPFFTLSSLTGLKSKFMYEKATAFYLRVGPKWQFPSRLEYPDLKILIVKQTHLVTEQAGETFSDMFLEETRAIQVLHLELAINEPMLPLVSLSKLDNLISLHVIGALSWRARDMSIIGKLKNLEILCLGCTAGKILPYWIGKLCNLRVLDLSKWRGLEYIPHNLLPGLAKLEEFYTPCTYDSNLSYDYLSDLMLLSHLTAYSGRFRGTLSFPDNFKFGNLQRYHIKTSNRIDSNYKWSRFLDFNELNDFSMKAFEHLLPGVEHLCIGKTMQAGIQNLCPQVNNTCFQNLREFNLWHSDSLECLVDTTYSKCVLKGRPHQNCGFQNIECIKLICCNKLKYLFSFRHAQRLQNLQHIVISECNALETIFTQDDLNNVALISFLELKTIEIDSCGELKYVIPLSFVAEGLPKLERISVEKCAKLEQVIGLDDGAETRNLVMKSLCSAKLVNLPRLSSLLPLNWHLKVPSLSQIVIIATGATSKHFSDDLHVEQEEEEEEVKPFGGEIPTSWNRILPFKEVILVSHPLCLNVENCDAEHVLDMENLVENNERCLIWNISELTLRYLPNLTCIWKGQTDLIQLRNLWKIQLYDCNVLTKSVFTYTMARTLTSLEIIEIYNCMELDNIFEPVSVGIKSCSPVACLPNLRNIDVRGCDKLKSLFQISVAQHLPRLRGVRVKGAAILEQLFSEDREKYAQDKQIILPDLIIIRLERLPCLSGICPAGYTLSCARPSMVEFIITECSFKPANLFSPTTLIPSTAIQATETGQLPHDPKHIPLG